MCVEHTVKMCSTHADFFCKMWYLGFPGGYTQCTPPLDIFSPMSIIMRCNAMKLWEARVKRYASIFGATKLSTMCLSMKFQSPKYVNFCIFWVFFTKNNRNLRKNTNFDSPCALKRAKCDRNSLKYSLVCRLQVIFD